MALFHQDDKKQKGSKTSADKVYTEQAVEESEHLFNDEFREELRNRGRLRFEKAINENAMFLKQDLDMTIAQLNEYLKKEIGGKLDAEFADYSKAMKEAQELALNSLKQSATAIESQRQELADAIQKYAVEREAALLKVFEENMAKIIENYVLQAVGEQFDLKAQLPAIIAQLEANKQSIMEDMKL